MSKRSVAVERRLTGPPRGRVRSGLTVVEVLVALVVLTVGVIALASTAALVVRQIGTSAGLATAAYLAQARLERLAGALGCGSLAPGSATSGGFAEEWTVAGGTSVVPVTVTVRIPPGARSVMVGSSVLCR
jgi:Tfp pilus assembly protein PilV